MNDALNNEDTVEAGFIPPAAPAAPWPLIGHAREVGFLQQAIRGYRVSHAYLFVGAEGCGKRSLALAFAQTLNCQSVTADGSPRLSPCGVCPSCVRIARGQHPDVLALDIERQRELVAGSGREADTERAARQRVISVATAHELRDHIVVRPYDARYKIAILGDADTMLDAAANSLLKTLEEPPRWAVIILLAANEGSVPATIRSRCQLISLRPVPRAAIRAALAQRGIATVQADLLAALAEGRPGIALAAAADRDAALAERNAALALLHTMIAPDALIADRFAVAARLATTYGNGPGGRASVNSTLALWLMWWRDLLLVKSGHAELITISDQAAALTSVAVRLDLPAIYARITALQTASAQLVAAVNPRLVLESLAL
jgi:DNA polymerase-3 subunit delta'